MTGKGNVSAEWASPEAGAIVRHDNAGNSELAVQADVGVAAVAAQAEAMVKARFALAQWRPRDFEQVRQRLMKDCLRPGFAEKAMYALPRGKEVVRGFGIRFAENAFRTMGNLQVTSAVIAEDRLKRVIQVSCTDLETNATDEVQVVLTKTVERKGTYDKAGKLSPPDGRDIVGERTNSYGEKVWIVVCTDAEILEKQSSVTSRMRRNKILEMVPFDVLEECRAAIEKTKALADKAVDPDTKKRQMIDSFHGIGVTVAQLVLWLEHPMDSVTPDEVDELRELFKAVKEGEITWAQVLGKVEEEKSKAPPKPDAKPAAPVSGTAATSPAAAGQAVPKPTPPKVVETPKVAEMSEDEKAFRAEQERAEAALAAEEAKAKTAAPVPVQVFSPAGSGGGVEEGSLQHADWMVKAITEVQTLAELKKLSRQQMHPDRKALIDMAYLNRSNELKAKEGGK